MESNNNQTTENTNVDHAVSSPSTEGHDLVDTPVPEANSQEITNKKTKKRKVIKLVMIIIASVFTVVLVGYIIMLLSSTGSLRFFGKPFWFENGRLYFGPSSCSAENEYLQCSVTGDPYSWCQCVEETYRDISLKPIIYLYPESVLALNVTLGNADLLTSSYPKYDDGWHIVAHPNGDLLDKATGKKFYALYWEGRRTISDPDMTTGFVVKGEDSAEFLDDKLSVLGLNYREKEEFIVYWLPKLELNKYNYIYFATEEEIEKEMPLGFSVEPDTVIRVRMLFDSLDEYKEVEEQTLTPAPERQGFTVVEWGGTDLSK